MTNLRAFAGQDQTAYHVQCDQGSTLTDVKRSSERNQRDFAEKFHLTY